MSRDFFDFQSIAVIGASNNPEKLGYNVVKNLRDYDFKGRVYPVNLKEAQIQGIRAYKDIHDVGDSVDLVVIAVPAAAVPPALQECVQKQVPLVIVLSAGFKETGKAGAELENRLKEIIKNSPTRLMGPNCLGLIDSTRGLSASFAADFPRYGNISFISQSGALGAAFLDWIHAENLGIHYFVSIGNKADLDENFFLEHIQDDNLIACYLEDIKDGRRFMELGYTYNTKRPVIILKPGRSKAAAEAISSHTGALAGGYNVVTTALKQSGYIEVRTIGEMFNKMKAFAWQPLPKDNKVAIVTNAGGPAVITTDLILEKGLELAVLHDTTKALLEQRLPRTVNIRNPMDIVGDALSDRYYYAMDTILREEDVSALIVLLTPQIMTEIEKTAKYIGKMKRYNKPVLACFIGGTLVEKGLQLLNEVQIPAYHFPETAVDVLSSMVWYSNYVRTASEHASGVMHKSPYYEENSRTILDYYAQAQAQSLGAFSPAMAQEIGRRYNICMPPAYKCASVDEAVAHANTDMNYPCVLKISSPSLIHKSDIGGVIADIKSESHLREGFARLASIIKERAIPGASVEVQQFITGGIPAIVGANRDPNFGNIIIFGSGGIYTEILNDVSRRIAPVPEHELRTMIDETRISHIIKGARGQKPLDIDGVIQTLKAVEYLMTDYDFIKSIDINPLLVDEDHVYAADLKILI